MNWTYTCDVLVAEGTLGDYTLVRKRLNGIPGWRCWLHREGHVGILVGEDTDQERLCREVERFDKFTPLSKVKKALREKEAA